MFYSIWILPTENATRWHNTATATQDAQKALFLINFAKEQGKSVRYTKTDDVISDLNLELDDPRLKTLDTLI